MRLKLKQRGDTIVEVMIVLAVLGLAISICYATANRSLLNTRQAQENAEATELLRGQIEALRTVACSLATDPSCHRPAAIITIGQSFCLEIKPDGTYQTKVIPAPDNGTLCNKGSVPYHMYIKLTDASSGTYTATAIWDSIQGGGKDTVTLTYRLPL